MLLRPILDAFTETHGVRVLLISAKADILIQRLFHEGKASKADMLLTVDAGRLYRAVQLKLFQPINDKKLSNLVPIPYRDAADQWLGLSVRTRVILGNDTVPFEMHMSYKDLASPKWREKICIRSSNNIYNQSLVASFIYLWGEEQTLSWAEALVANMARPPAGGDRAQIIASANGACSLAIVNSYYYGMMLNSSVLQHVTAAKKMHIVRAEPRNIPHVNISGAGITRHAKNIEEAKLLLSFLLSKKTQEWYGKVNYEYPVRTDVVPNELLRSWGTPDISTVPMDALGELNKKAVRLMDLAGWE